MKSARAAEKISAHLKIRQDWLDSQREEVIDPELPIVDPHHHLVDRPETGRYLLDQFLDDIGTGHNITATVFLEWLSMYRADGPPHLRPVGEIEFANGVAAMSASGRYGKTRICAGLVGHADLALGAEVEETLTAMVAVGGGRLKGVRLITTTDPEQSSWSSMAPRPAGLLMDKNVREGFARLARMNLSFDAWLYHPQIPELIDLARAFPDTRIVLDHVGGVLGLGRYAGKRDEVFQEWSQSIRDLAQHPNVCVKVGGLGMRTFGFGFDERPMPPSSQQLADAWRPYVETCVEAFGTPRVMFESNFPVDKISYSYVVLWNAFKRITANYSQSEKADLFADTATRFYRLA